MSGKSKKKSLGSALKRIGSRRKEPEAAKAADSASIHSTFSGSGSLESANTSANVLGSPSKLSVTGLPANLNPGTAPSMSSAAAVAATESAAAHSASTNSEKESVLGTHTNTSSSSGPGAHPGTQAPHSGAHPDPHAPHSGPQAAHTAQAAQAAHTAHTGPQVAQGPTHTAHTKTAPAHTFAAHSRPTIARSASLAALAREHRQKPDPNDTRAFFNSPSLPATQASSRPPSRPASPHEALPADYLQRHSRNLVENSNFLYRTGSRIWTESREDAGEQMWYDSPSRHASRRNSLESDPDEVLSFGARSRPHSRATSRQPSRAASRTHSRIHSRRGSNTDETVIINSTAGSGFVSLLGDSGSDSDSSLDSDASQWEDLGHSRVMRITDWFLGLPQDKSNGLRDFLSKKSLPLDSNEKRRYREQGLASDPAWLLAVAAVVKDLSSI